MANIATITNNIISALSGTTSQVLLGDATLTDFKLDSLTDVNVPTPGDGDVLKWNATTSLWEASDAAGITGSGLAGQVAYFTGATTQAGSNNLFWNNTNGRLGIGTNTPTTNLSVVGNVLINTTSITQPFAITETSTSYRSFLIDYSATFQTQINFGLFGRFQYDGNGGIMNIENRSTQGYTRIFLGTTERMRLLQTGNLILQNGGTFTDSGQRLQVTGDTLMKGSGNTSATTALTVQNSDGALIFTARNDRTLVLGSSALPSEISINGSGSALRIYQTRNSTNINDPLQDGYFIGSTSSTNSAYSKLWLGFTPSTGFNSTSGNPRIVTIQGSFIPTSGTSTFGSLILENIINQTGGANGITRGLYIQPTLTAAADWRSIEWSNNTGWGLYGVGTAPNYLRGNTAINTTTINDAGLTINQSVNGTNVLLSLRNDAGGINNEVSIKMIAGANNAGEIGTILSHVRQGISGGDFIIKTGATLSSTSVERLRVKNNGNVLIGSTTDSGEKLQVTGTAKITGNLAVDTNVLFVDTTNDRVGIGTASPATRLEIVGATGLQIRNGATDGFNFQQSNTNSWSWTALTSVSNYNIQNANVGIGTASPSYKLDVQGTSGTVAIRAASSTAGDILYYATGTVTGSLNAFTTSINATGSVGASLQNNNTATGSAFLDINVPSASTGDPYLVFTTSGATNWSIGTDNSDSDKLKFGNVSNPSNGATTLVLHTTGNTSLGSAADSGERLQVTGTAKITGASSFATASATDFVGIGTTTPSAKLEISRNSVLFEALRLTAITNAGVDRGTFMTFYVPSGTNSTRHGATITAANDSTASNTYLSFSTQGTSGILERMRLDASGNLGLGVTPSAWGADTKAIQLGGSTFSCISANVRLMQLANAYWDGTNFKYLNSAINALQYRISGGTGAHEWYNAPIGTAGANISFTQAMTLTSAGRLILGAGDSGELLQVNGTAKITGNTSVGGSITITGQANFTGVANFAANTNQISSEGRLRLHFVSNSETRIIGDGIRFRNNAGSDLASMSTAGDMSITRNFTVDTNTLFVDATNNRVGIGTATPTYLLDVNGDALINGVRVGKGPNSLSGNTVLGASALNGVTTGTNNVAIGPNAIDGTTTGNYNIAIGFMAGGIGATENTTGSSNIFIGTEAQGLSSTESNRTWIGSNTTVATWLGGNLLVGTRTNSTHRLDVVGTTRLSSTLLVGGVTTLTNLAGTGTRIVVTDASGNLSTQPTDTYLTSLTGEATNSGSVVTLTNSAVIGKLLTGLNITSASIAATDSILSAFGKIQGQIDGLQGGTIYKGSWNASTNTPTITSGTGTQGNYYVVTTAGTTTIDGVSSWAVGDWIIYNGTVWEKIPNVDAITSVNGQTGVVSLTTTNINEGTNLYYTDARAIAAISLTTSGASGASTYSSGVLNIPTYTLAGLGGVATGTTITINGVAQDLSTNRTYSVGTVTSIVAGSYLTGGTITGSGTIAVDATTTNTASKIVARDSSGNFSAGTITATLTGTASNATTAGGLSVHTDRNNEVNKIVRTDANGYIQAGWINTTSGDNGTTAIDRIYASSDAYLRYYTPANFRTVLDVPTRTGGSASGTWAISVTGNAATATNVAYSGLTGTVPTWNQNTTGNAATASTSSQVTINYSNNSGGTHQMLWGSGNSVYGTGNITCIPGSGIISLTGNLNSGGIGVVGFGRMYGGDFWHSGTANNGTRTPTLKLGRFSDSETPAYIVYTNDTDADTLEFFSERYAGDFRLTRNSETGLRNTMRVNSDNGGSVIDLYTGDGSSLGAKIQSNGDARFAYDVVAYYSFSDARLKTNVLTIENPLQKVMAMRGVSYEWLEGHKKGKKEIGLIAQEVMEIIPEVVSEKERIDGSKFLSVDYEHLTGLLIEAVKELKKEVDELKSK